MAFHASGPVPPEAARGNLVLLAGSRMACQKCGAIGKQGAGLLMLPCESQSLCAPNRKQRQYYEMFGNRAIWVDGWKAVTLHANRNGFAHALDRRPHRPHR